ncbi:nitrile hydratase subunit beta [Roseovarius sp. D22-M7]|uniref:nitrile hydratase subunit beta n=1 Tax=Roseovarius sp. D22-M7 TaxID=3127116 RepID=UPI00300FE5C1
MNGPQDLGGQMGFGAIAPEGPAEPLFHAPWEARALALTLASGALGRWTIDESRHVRESLHPAVYYNSSYYEIWTRALERLLLAHDLITEADLAAGTAAPGAAHPRQLAPEAVRPALARGTPTDRPLQTPPSFRPGDPVRARVVHPRGHTRLPRYVRGAHGVIEADHGGHVFPDTNAHGLGEAPQRLYTVVFEGRTLWGPDVEPGLRVSVDAWESYLDPA